MRAIISILIIVSLLAVAGVAFADSCNNSCATEYWNDTATFQRSDVTQFEFTHDLGSDGFIAGTDWVKSAELTIFFDNGKTVKDFFRVELDSPSHTFSYANTSLDIYLVGLARFDSSGKLTVQIYNKFGSFYIEASELHAEGNECAPVPEPGTCALLGMGVIACGLYLRRRNAA